MAKKSLLIVDSDARSQRLLEVSLRKAGFSITTATNGLDALDKVHISIPDLIIADTKLAEVDGFEFCRRIKADAKLDSIPFIFLTAQKSIEHKIKGLELGVDDYLTKPIYMKEVITRVRILIEKRDKETLERRDRSGFGGRLGDMGVVDLLQTVELGRKTGVLHLENKAQSGDIWFRNGKIVDGEIGRLRGDMAIYRFLVWNDGIFSIDFDEHGRPDNIELSTQGLLMEGMRRLDEWGRLLEQLPPLDNRFDIDYREFASRLAEIPDEVNSILRLFDGRRTLMEIMDASEFGDLEALNIISKLFFEGLIHDVSDDDLATDDRADPSVNNWLEQPLPDPVPAPPTETRAPASSEQLTPAPEPDPEPPPEEAPGSQTITEPQLDLGAISTPEPASPGAEIATSEDAAEDGSDETSVSSWLEQPLPSAPSGQPTDIPAATPPVASSDDENKADADDEWEDVAAPPEENLHEANGEEAISLASDTEDSLEEALNRELESTPQTPVELTARRKPTSTEPPVREAAHLDDADLAEQLIAEAMASVDGSVDGDLADRERVPSEAPTETADHAFSPPQNTPISTTSAEASSSTSESQAAKFEAIVQEIPDETDIVEESSPTSTPHGDEAPAVAEDQFFAAPETQAGGGGRALSTPSFGNEDLPPLLPTAPGRDSTPPVQHSKTKLLMAPLLLFVVGGTVSVLVISGPGSVRSRLFGSQNPALASADASQAAVKPDAAHKSTPAHKPPAPDAAVSPNSSAPTPKTLDAGQGPTPADAKTKASPGNKPKPNRDTTPKTYEHYIKRGRSLAERGRLRPAIAAFRKALDLNKRSPETQTALANAYYELDELGSAERHLKKAIKIAPRYAPAYVLLGTVYQSMGRNSEAITAYDRYLVLAPMGPFAKDVRDVVTRLKAEK